MTKKNLNVFIVMNKITRFQNVRKKNNLKKQKLTRLKEKCFFLKNVSFEKKIKRLKNKNIIETMNKIIYSKSKINARVFLKDKIMMNLINQQFVIKHDMKCVSSKLLVIDWFRKMKIHCYEIYKIKFWITNF